MKKTALRVITIILIIVMCASMAVVAAAADPNCSSMAVVPAMLDPNCSSMLADFPTQYAGASNGYVGLIQASMYAYNSKTREKITGSGGIDEVNGSGTMAAVKIFQEDIGFSRADCDGIVGSKTWPELGRKMIIGDAGTDGKGYYVIYKFNDIPNAISIMKKYGYSDSLYYYCYGYPKTEDFYPVKN